MSRRYNVEWTRHHPEDEGVHYTCHNLTPVQLTARLMQLTRNHDATIYRIWPAASPGHAPALPPQPEPEEQWVYLVELDDGKGAQYTVVAAWDDKDDEWLLWRPIDQSLVSLPDRWTVLRYTEMHDPKVPT